MHIVTKASRQCSVADQRSSLALYGRASIRQSRALLAAVCGALFGLPAYGCSSSSGGQTDSVSASGTTGTLPVSGTSGSVQSGSGAGTSAAAGGTSALLDSGVTAGSAAMPGMDASVGVGANAGSGANAGTSAGSTAGDTTVQAGASAAADAGEPNPTDAAAPGMDAEAGSAVGPDAMTMMPDAGSMTTDDEDGGVCEPPETPLDVSGIAECPTDICPGHDSVCMPLRIIASVVPESTLGLLADCSDTEKCVPRELASTLGRGIQPTCTSVNGAEGRCISSCVPLVATQASLLPKDVCTGNDLCAPCYDPRTGEDTLACRQGCDPGPTQPPKVFAHCCSDRGLCVPPQLAGSQAGSLDKDTCTGDTLCAPTDLTDPTFKPKHCDSIDGAEGRCMSTCIGGAVARQKDRLPTQGCGQDEVCAPCFDPITGEDTGACSVNGDAPEQPKYTFPHCCSNGAGDQVGVCVTPELAGDQASMLKQDTCARGRLCAPIKKAADPNYKFPSCRGLGAGACVPSCILDPLEAAILSRVSCGVGELCAPCSTLGVSTGACD